MEAVAADSAVVVQSGCGGLITSAFAVDVVQFAFARRQVLVGLHFSIRVILKAVPNRNRPPTLRNQSKLTSDFDDHFEAFSQDLVL